MSGTARTLLVVAIFVAFMVSSFIWFVATWDAENEAPIGLVPNTERSIA